MEMDIEFTVIATSVVLGVLSFAAACIGYVMNFVEVLSALTHDGPVTMLFVARAAGVFFPVIGAVLGWF